MREMVLISVSATNRKLLWLSLILACPHLDLYKRKKLTFLPQEGKKVGLMHCILVCLHFDAR